MFGMRNRGRVWRVDATENEVMMDLGSEMNDIGVVVVS